MTLKEAGDFEENMKGIILGRAGMEL